MSLRTRHKLGSFMATIMIAALAFTGCSSSGGGGDTTPVTSIKPTFTVTDGAGLAVANAKVYAIPAADVEALAAVPISSATSTSGNYSEAALAADEPLEDLIKANGATYNSATTDADGKAVFTADLNASALYFMYVEPATSGHLPGSDICRVAKAGSSMNNATTALKISSAPSISATFVGSSTCLTVGCHADKADVKKTMHKLGIKTMGVESDLQDKSEFISGDYDIDNALTNKFTTDGTTIYFYNYDSTRGFDKFMTLESAPTGTVTVYATVRIYKDSADQKYKAQFTNVINSSDPNSGMIHEVKMSYGGGVYKQRYMTTIGDSIYLIPLQFNQRGEEASLDRVRRNWRDYHMDWWVASITKDVTMTFQDIANGGVPTDAKGVVKTFDAECASCHFNNFTYDPAKKQATGVADAFGETHPVTGVKQELNIGCETCHGPGSEHVTANGGKGKKIVNPALITPERSSMICGQCHSRPLGNGAFGKNDAPVNTSNKMMIAGTSRADFLANYTSRHDARLDPSAGKNDYWADDANHSKSHHQQYTDFIRTAKYRNGTQLLTCASCHNPHGPGTDRHQLSGSSDNSGCTSCHTSVEISAHQTAKTGATMGSSVKCIDCHVTKTSNSGAGLNQLASEGVANSADPKKPYLHGDISSHLFDVPTRANTSASMQMPVPFTAPNAAGTSKCGGCHDFSSF